MRRTLGRDYLRNVIMEERTRISRTRRLSDLLFEQDEKSSDEKPAGGDKSIDTKRMPMKLSQVDADFAKKIVQAGDKDADKITVTKGDVGTCASLKPSQTSMNINKALQFTLSMLNGTMPQSGGPGGDLNCFVSSDDYIMDGHHRWIASGMADPSVALSGYKAELPGKELLSVLNTITKGMFGKDKGNPGTGGFDQFADKQAMSDALQLQIDGKAPTIDGKSTQGPIGGKPEDIQGILEKFTGTKGDGAKDAAVDKMMKNLGGMHAKQTDVMPGAPDRADMPVIDGGENEKAATALNTGEIDAFPPYSVKKEGIAQKDSAIMERWARIAGILND